MNSDTDDLYYIAFSRTLVGPNEVYALKKGHKTVKEAWEQWQRMHPGVVIDPFADKARIRAIGAFCLPITHPKYPKLLAEIADPPYLLYGKGRSSGKPIDMEKTIAVVGARKMTPYGKQMTERIVKGLVQRGYTIVSGMAYGIDTVAHTTAIQNGGKTIAVLGCGIDIIAPEGNANVYHEIVGGGGAVISEMPLSIRPSKTLFVMRNRIISGLSRGVVVIEGAQQSGTMITVSFAAKQGRDVFAVPGNVTSRTSRATTDLLKQGAKLVESADDIVEEYE